MTESIGPRVWMCSVPSACWATASSTAPSIGTDVRDAVGSLRRVRKGVNLRLELDRYAMLCRLVGNTVLSAPGFQQCRRLDEIDNEHTWGWLSSIEYLLALQAVVDVDPSSMWLTSPLIPPDQVSQHHVTFEAACVRANIVDHIAIQRRISFLAHVHRCGAGVVDIQVDALPQPTPDLTPSTARNASESKAGSAGVSWNLGRDDAPLRGKHKMRALQQLRASIAEAAAVGGPIRLARYANDVIAEALHSLAFHGTARSDQIRIVFEDGSESPPLVVGGLGNLPSESTWLAMRPLRVTLMSMRHLEQDADVDLAWFRNAELSRSGRSAELEELAFTHSQAMLDDLSGRDTSVLLDVHHTGFQPALIGFYRALIGHLHQRRGQICMRPCYFRGTGHPVELGTAWF